MASYYVGTSGWRYAGWRGDFYPTGLLQRRERPTSYARWRDKTPADFLFAVEGGRYITHMKQLRDVGTPVANFPADQPVRHALEPRYPSFDTDGARTLLRRHDICMVVADSAGRTRSSTPAGTRPRRSTPGRTSAARGRHGDMTSTSTSTTTPRGMPHDAMVLLERLRTSP